MENPYSPPLAEPPVEPSFAGNIEGRAWAITGLVLMLGPIVGLLGTILGMKGAFNKLSEGGQPNATDLAEAVSATLWSTVIGMIAGLIGLVLVVVAAFVMKNRERWFFITTLTLSAIWCLVLFPIGMLAGGALIILFVTIRQEFGARSSQA